MQPEPAEKLASARCSRGMLCWTARWIAENRKRSECSARRSLLSPTENDPDRWSVEAGAKIPLAEALGDGLKASKGRAGCTVRPRKTPFSMAGERQVRRLLLIRLFQEATRCCGR